nr:VRR-NUC domain-containing protein [Burkholderia gladioli]
MLEKTVEAYLVERVRALGGTAYKFTSPARASVPDRIVILPPGRIFFVELKRPGGKLTRGQEREHEHLRRLGADVRMLDSIGAINAFLNGVQAAAADGPSTDETMSLRVALDFADNPRPVHALCAPADTNGELYRALRVLADAYRRAAVSPATAEPCAHDYVRSDRVCTECGEKTATADERAALDMALKLRAAGVAGTTVGDMLHAAAAMIEAYASQAAIRASQAAAPAEAREPSRVGRADIVDGRVQSFAFEQTDIPTGSYSLYTAPVGVPADAGEAVAPDPIAALIARHAEELDRNDYAYFELAYTHQTGWMAWITDKPLQGPVLNPDRKVLARGQGGTPAEACRDALDDAQAAQGGKGGKA